MSEPIPTTSRSSGAEAAAVLERRRAPRRRLRASTCVTLKASPHSGEQAVEGALLNVSPHGMAVRANADAVREFTAGSVLRCTFCAGGEDELFVFPARVVSATRGGDVSSVVLGVEFVETRDTVAALERLRARLASQPSERVG